MSIKKDRAIWKLFPIQTSWKGTLLSAFPENHVFSDKCPGIIFDELSNETNIIKIGSGIKKLLKVVSISLSISLYECPGGKNLVRDLETSGGKVPSLAARGLKVTSAPAEVSIYSF